LLDGRRLTRRALAAALAIALASSAQSSPVEPQIRACDAYAQHFTMLAPGDVVFIGVDAALWARTAATLSTPEHRFGHVGMAARDSAGRMVIVHATGSPTANNARVITAAPADFAAEADRIGIYRPLETVSAPAAARAALDFAARNLAFDKDFRLESEDALYCTELIWRALSAAAGRDVAPNKPHLMGRSAITLETLETSPVLQEIEFVRRPPNAC
jgi:hypothetical protein